MADNKAERPSLHPRNWGGWLAVSVMWLLALLPFQLLARLMLLLSPLMRKLMQRRARIAEQNIQACFPEKSSQERTQTLHQCFRSIAVSLAETLKIWACRDRVLIAGTTVEGLEHLAAAKASGQGLLILSSHMACMELLAPVMTEKSSVSRLAIIYRRLGNPVVEWYQNRGRSKSIGKLIPRRDMRQAIRHLRNGDYLWYAPDQDFGPENSLFIPFFGIQTATLMATHRLASLGRAVVIPMFIRRDDLGQYTVCFKPAIAGVPSDNPENDLLKCNQLIEDWVREAPEQYWWIHRRFKTRPPGEPPFYQL